MTRLAALLVAGTLFAAAPSFAQTVGSCARGGGANQPQAVWVLFDVGSAQVRPGDKPRITEAAATAKARQVTSICVVGHTDKLGDKALNEQLGRARSKGARAAGPARTSCRRRWPRRQRSRATSSTSAAGSARR